MNVESMGPLQVQNKLLKYERKYLCIHFYLNHIVATVSSQIPVEINDLVSFVLEVCYSIKIKRRISKVQELFTLY